MSGTMYGAAVATRDAYQERASEDVWTIVRELEAVLPPAQMRLVHQLRLAAEMAGALRAVAPATVLRA